MNPYNVILYRYQTEKSNTLLALRDATSNKSVSRFRCAKYTFVVAQNATKAQVAMAVEEMYPNVKVRNVNVINVKAKPIRFRMRPGTKKAFRKAIVTLHEGQQIEAAN